MTANADLLNRLTIDDYASIAFSLDPTSKTGFGEGGVYAGPLDKGSDGKPWHNQYQNPADSAIAARARLVNVPVGKVFVRWANAGAQHDWKVAAGGAWWVTDNMAERIVQGTAKRFGPRGDSSMLARQYAQVSTRWSDMTTVVVCRVTRPIKVLFGVGRPVAGVPNISPALGDELQVVILTTIRSPKNSPDPKDPNNRVRFIGDEFMTNLWIGSSSAFTTWWLNAGIVDLRRRAQRSPLHGR